MDQIWSTEYCEVNVLWISFKLTWLLLFSDCNFSPSGNHKKKIWRFFPFTCQIIADRNLKKTWSGKNGNKQSNLWIFWIGCWLVLYTNKMQKIIIKPPDLNASRKKTERTLILAVNACWNFFGKETNVFR